MEDHGPWVVDGHVEHDEGAVLAALEQPGNFCGLSVKNRRHLAYLFSASEGQYLQGNRQIHVCFGHQRPERRTHLLEMECDIPAALLAGIGDNRKVRRTYFHPLRVARKTLARPQNEAS